MPNDFSGMSDSLINDPDIYEHFGDVNDYIQPYNTPDSFLGLGNKHKQAERRLARAEKKIAKGKTKAGERLLNLANTELNKEAAAQTATQAAQALLTNVNQTDANISATNTAATESPLTAAGQIGLAAQPTTLTAAQQLAQEQAMMGSGGGGGGGDYPSYTDTGTDSVDSGSQSTDTGDSGSTDTSTTTATPAKSNTMTYIIIAAVVIAAYFFFVKGGGKKLFKTSGK